MSNNNNDEATGIMIAFAFVGAVALMIMVVVYALVVFLAAILTVLSLLAWDSPLEVGPVEITPEEARFFVGAGMASAAVCPLFVMMCSWLFEFRVSDDAWFHIFLGSYAFGSIILTTKAAEAGAFDNGVPHYNVEPLPPPIDVTPRELTSPEQPPSPPSEFRYATWDDEEAGR